MLRNARVVNFVERGEGEWDVCVSEVTDVVIERGIVKELKLGARSDDDDQQW